MDEARQRTHPFDPVLPLAMGSFRVAKDKFSSAYEYPTRDEGASRSYLLLTPIL
jgi:hypothetical protein